MLESRLCDNCGKIVPTEAILYNIRIEIFASPETPQFTDEELEEDHIEKMNEILDEMSDMDTQEVTDQVYEAYQFNLCPACREDLHKKLKLTGKQQFLE